MIVEGRTVAVILLYIFTFLGYLLGRTSESEEEKKIKEARYFVDFELDATVGVDYKEELDIIETALKRLEALDVIRQKVNEQPLPEIVDNGDGSFGWQGQDELVFVSKIEYQKKLRALEIIVKKEVNVFVLAHSDSKETYNDMVSEHWRELTQEEFDFLKEVLS